MYHYEFGIMIGESEDDPAESTSVIVIDLRQIASFWEVKKHKGPHGRIFPSLANVMDRSGNSTLLYYPYDDFRDLFERSLKADIQTMPYPA